MNQKLKNILNDFDGVVLKDVAFSIVFTVLCVVLGWGIFVMIVSIYAETQSVKWRADNVEQAFMHTPTSFSFRVRAPDGSIRAPDTSALGNCQTIHGYLIQYEDVGASQTQYVVWEGCGAAKPTKFELHTRPGFRLKGGVNRIPKPQQQTLELTGD